MDQMFIQCLLHADKNALLLRLNWGKARARMIKPTKSSKTVFIVWNSHKTNRVWMLRLCFLLWCQSARCKCERLGMDAMKRDAEHKTHCMTYFSVRLYKENKIVSYSFLGWPIRCQGPPWTPLWLRHWVIGLAYTNINLFYGLWYK